MRLVFCWLAFAVASCAATGLLPGRSCGVASAQQAGVATGGDADKPTKPLSIVFILDCSYSMSGKFEPGAGKPAITRLVAARTALKTVLDELADAKRETPVDVGVWLFGHRVGWIFPDRLTRNPQAANGPIPADLAPAEDVERILPLGMFGHPELGHLNERIARVTHLGQSPVNLAILQALSEFDPGGNATKRIIVITDGINDQSQPRTAGLRPVRVIAAGDVVDEWKRIKVPIAVSIVYLGDPANLQEYDEIVKATGGQLLEPKTGAELLKNVRKLSREE